MKICLIFQQVAERIQEISETDNWKLDFLGKLNYMVNSNALPGSCQIIKGDFMLALGSKLQSGIDN